MWPLTLTISQWWLVKTSHLARTTTFVMLKLAWSWMKWTTLSSTPCGLGESMRCHVIYRHELGDLQVTRTYAIHAVVDQSNKQKVTFTDAVRMGLIDKETGKLPALYWHYHQQSRSRALPRSNGFIQLIRNTSWQSNNIAKYQIW